jgi:ankyrin repeat protein
LGQYHISDYIDDKGVASLAAAAAKGNVREIDRLVENEVNVNFVGKDGMTPLWWAYLARNTEGFRSLLGHGGDPNVQDDKGRSIMCFSAADADDEYLRLALAFGGNPSLVSEKSDFAEPTPIFCAARDETVGNIRTLVAAGANLDYQEFHEETALVYAAGLNEWSAVYALLEGGADYTIKDGAGTTIVYNLEKYRLSKKSGGYQWREKVIEFLRERGVEVTPIVP